MEKVKLTKEEFIKRSMNGEIFEFDGCKYFYDEAKVSPFRINSAVLVGSWEHINGNNEFTVVEPKPEMISVAQFCVCVNGMYRIVDSLFETLDEFKIAYHTEVYSNHQEVPNTRFEVPKVSQ